MGGKGRNYCIVHTEIERPHTRTQETCRWKKQGPEYSTYHLKRIFFFCDEKIVGAY